VEETEQALRFVGAALEAGRPAQVRWCLDRPVSNSARLVIERLDDERGWPWSVELLDNPDRALAESGEAVATTDAVILDRCVGWVCLPEAAVGTNPVWQIDLK
jgi:hypothetical protein